MPTTELHHLTTKLDAATHAALIAYARTNGHLTYDGRPRLSIACRKALQAFFASSGIGWKEHNASESHNDEIRRTLHETRVAIKNAVARLWR